MLAKINTIREELNQSWLLQKKDFFDNLKMIDKKALRRSVGGESYRELLGVEDDEDIDVKNSENCWDSVKYIWGKYHLTFVIIFFVWMFGCAAVHVFLNDWDFSSGFYYSIQSGFSVGFGVLSELKYHGKNLMDECSELGSVDDGHAWMDSTGLQLVNGFKGNSEFRKGTNYRTCAYIWTDNEYKNISMAYTIVSQCYYLLLFTPAFKF